jgi:quercetin dioxygenase-like cupin family protein
MKLKIFFTALTSILLSGNLQATTNITPVLPNSDSLKWTTVKDMPEGAKVAVLMGNPAKRENFIALLKLPAGYSVPVHSHPVNEYDTVLSGVYNLGTGKRIQTIKTVALPTGSFVTIPAKTLHYGFTKEETIIEISGEGPWGMIYPNENAVTRS